MESSPAAARPPGVPAGSGTEPRPARSCPLSTCTAEATPGLFTTLGKEKWDDDNTDTHSPVTGVPSVVSPRVCVCD